MTRWITTAIGTAALALAACVTINVYFPAAAAEKAADRIIEDVWGKDAKGNEQSALPADERGVLLAAFRGALEFVVPAANAQADLDVSTPAIRSLTPPRAMTSLPRTSSTPASSRSSGSGSR